MARPFVIVGDEAWLAEDYEAEQRRRERGREYARAWNRAYGQRPEVKARKAAYHREWVERNREKVRKYKRQYAHGERPRLIGSLHGLACKGPTQDTGCRCRKKIRCYDKPR